MAATILLRWPAFVLLLLALAGATALPAAETLTVSFTTTSAGGPFSPKNIVAVWVETQAGAFVKTIGDWSSTQRADLTSWRANAGTSDTDAVMGPTRLSNTGTLTVAWNMLPRGGTTAVADGTYTVRFELCDTNQHTTGVSFVKNGTASTVGPVTQGGYNNITLIYSGRPAVIPVPTITSASVASATVGHAFSYTITASNTPTSYSATGLPPGLTVDTANGVISGTPTSPGISSVIIGASNATGAGTATLTLTTTAAPTITSASAASATVGSAFSYAITASNAPTSYSATGLPPGLAVDTANGVISGMPTSAGTSSVTIGASNAAGAGTATLTLTIATPVAGVPLITSAATASGALTHSFTYTITATNAPTSFSASGLPSGLSVNTASGVISGTPTAAGVFTVTIGGANVSGTGHATITMDIIGAPLITSAASASGALTHAFTYTITATNTPSSFSATGLPAGLAINIGSGVISGTPTAIGTFTVTLGATNGSGTGHATLALTIFGVPVISSTLTASATSNAPFSYAITANPAPSAYSASGLPPGLTVDTSSGIISGTPTSTGTSSITIGATNAAGSGSATLVLTVSDAAAGSGPPPSAQGPGHCGYGTGYAALLIILLALFVVMLRPTVGRADA